MTGCAGKRFDENFGLAVQGIGMAKKAIPELGAIPASLEDQVQASKLQSITFLAASDSQSR